MLSHEKCGRAAIVRLNSTLSNVTPNASTLDTMCLPAISCGHEYLYRPKSQKRFCLLKKGTLAKTGQAGLGIHPSVMRNVKSRLHDERLPKCATGGFSTDRNVFERHLLLTACTPHPLLRAAGSPSPSASAIACSRVSACPAAHATTKVASSSWARAPAM